MLFSPLCICCATVWLGAGGVNYVSCVHFSCMVELTGRTSGEHEMNPIWRGTRPMPRLASPAKERTLKEALAHRDSVHAEL